MMKSRESAGGLELPTRKQRTLWQEIWRAKQAYLLLLPIFIALGLFVYYPPVSAVYHAFLIGNLPEKTRSSDSIIFAPCSKTKCC
jgi:hypothetical protein